MCFFELSMCSIRSSIPDFVSKFQFIHILNSLRKLVLHFSLFYPHFWIFRVSISTGFLKVSTLPKLYTFQTSAVFLFFLLHPQFHILEFSFYRHLQFLDFSILSIFSISSYLNQIEPLFLIDPGSEWFYNQKHVLQSHQSRKLSPAERGRVVQILSG